MSWRTFGLGLPSVMNDKKELSDFPNADWNRVFYSCFMDEKNESIAMWSMYGRPWADGISVSIDNKTFKNWIGECKRFYLKDDNRYLEIDTVDLHTSRIAYTNELTKKASDSVCIKCGGRENHYIDNIFKNDFDYESSVFAGLIKDTAWSYENEIRIRADYFGKDNPSAIYIDVPDEVIESMIITSGPLFYGNLEYRIREANWPGLKLRQSSFTSLLKDMPCSNISWTGDCKEAVALKAAMDTTPNVKKLSLYELSGKGTFLFDDNGVISIGKGEYEFELKWSREDLHIIIEGNLGHSTGNTVIPAPNTFSFFDFYTEGFYDCCGNVVLVVNDYGRVAALKIESIKNRKELSFEYKIYVGSRIQFYHHKLFEEKKQNREESIEDEICGRWCDVNSKRAHMDIWKDGDMYRASVEWSSGAEINTFWTMSGNWDKQEKKMKYIDEKCETVKGYKNIDCFELITEYENGTGELILKGNELFWSKGYQCKFVRVKNT